MSYYDYATYGAEETVAEPVYEESTDMMVEDDSEPMEMTPAMMAFFLVPLVDLFAYYKINDFNVVPTDEWTNAANVCLAGGAIKIVGIAAYMAAGVKTPIAIVSIVQELAALYLINTADGKLTSSDVNMYYGAAAFGAVVSIAKVATMPKDDDEMMEDDYYGDAAAEDEAPADDSAADAYSGYYGYY